MKRRTEPRGNPLLLYGALGFLGGVILGIVGVGALVDAGRIGFGMFSLYGGGEVLIALVVGPAVGTLLGVGVGAIRVRQKENKNGR